ncbi:orotidine-5'-phosphate decarboxylase [Exophiala viscosa]|uniref:Orotidine 5'-phosphate decarboxylase n=1 Tax=Exophiala viscosa TaxID=2486360 RepID=A0AAN6IGB0_9EURO|nr:orotidine-5'-phosphate decarboxylase [Exophiala viscosa]
MVDRHRLSFHSRANLPGTSPFQAQLCSLIEKKQSALCLAADVDTSAELLQVAEELGDVIVILKTHADAVEDWSKETADALLEISKRKDFLIFEDRKFADIGSTVQKQYIAGPFKIATWAHLTTVHIFPGPAIVRALEEAANKLRNAEMETTNGPSMERGILLLAQMSSEGSLVTGECTSSCIEAARKHPDFVTGLIGQSNLRGPQDNFLIMTPGVQLPPDGQIDDSKMGDGLGQQYRTPRKVVLEEGCDIIIVGRGILSAQDRVQQAEKYRLSAWTAYQERIA